MPIEEALQIDLARRNFQQINRPLDIDLDIQLAQNAAKFRERFHRRPALFCRHHLHLVADIIIGEFTHRPLFPVDIKHNPAADFHMLGHGLERIERVVRMVQHPFRKHDINRPFRHRNLVQIGLNKPRRPSSLRKTSEGDIHRRRHIHTQIMHAVHHRPEQRNA